LTTAASIAGWVELTLLRRSLNRRIGHTSLPASWSVKVWGAALAAAALAWGVKLAIPFASPLLRAGLILTPYGLGFFAIALALGVPEARGVWRRMRV
jgi:putative peptidoglycan lipid II flippase